MDDTGARDSSVPQLGLMGGAALIGDHRLVEHRLFVLTGRWSVEAAAGPDRYGVADFLAMQSAIHGWRLAEWERRSPGAVGLPEVREPTGWDRAFAIADSATTARGRLACWYQVLAVHLAARYRRHRAMTSPVSDAGVERWLDIAQRDVLDGVAQGATVAARRGGPDDSGRSAGEVAEVVAACLAPLLDLGF